MKQLIDKKDLMAEVANLDARFDHTEQLVIYFDDLMDMIETMKPVNSWRKSYPEFDTPVLVSNGKQVWADRMILTDSGEIRYEESGASIPGTRWMPFPAPHTEEE